MEAREGHEAAENKPKPSIRLEFFRHDEKGSSIPGEPDHNVRLTPKGRVHATEAGKEKNPEPEVALVYGTSRERSTETAMRHMLANEESIGPDATLEDMQELTAGHMELGKKNIVSEKLNFNWAGTPEYKEVAYDHYNNQKDVLKFITQESDELVKKLKDKDSTSWSRQAGNVAEIIKKYIDILPTWQRVASEHPEKYEQFANEMQRFLGSHQTITESFLMKVIAKTQGSDAVAKFIESLPDKNGFGFSEGYAVILGGETGADVILNYKDQKWELTSELIDEIIKDRNQLDKSIA